MYWLNLWGVIKFSLMCINVYVYEGYLRVDLFIS